MSTDEATATRRAYQWCHALVQAHYENFPVASRLLPRRLRDPVAAIYAFARTADDLADEGSLGTAMRLERLAAMESALHTLPHDEPLYLALGDTIRRHHLPLAPFRDLLAACRQDLSKTRYASFGELMEYCRRSANPVGRLLLRLGGEHSPRNLALSDAICSALQLVNILQDLACDYHSRGRLYLPQDELQRFGVSECDIAEQRNGPNLVRLFRFQLARAAGLLRNGSPLGLRLGGRFGFEVRLIVLAGARVLQKLHKQDDIFAGTRLHPGDRLLIMSRALTAGVQRRRDLP